MPPAWWLSPTYYNGGSPLTGYQANNCVVGNNVREGNIFLFLLPFIEQNNLYQQCNDGAGHLYGHYAQRNHLVVKTYICPGDGTSWQGVTGTKATGPNLNYQGYPQANYYANMYVFNPVTTGSIVTSMPSGTSNTVMFAEHIFLCYTNNSNNLTTILAGRSLRV